MAATVVAFALGLPLWARHIVLPLKPGLHRLVATLPLVPALFAATATVYPHPHSDATSHAHGAELLTFMLAYLLLGLNTAKVLALCLNRGPLAAAAAQGVSLWMFYGMAGLPLAPCAEQGSADTSLGSLGSSASASRGSMCQVIGPDNCQSVAVRALLKGVAAAACGGLLQAGGADPPLVRPLVGGAAWLQLLLAHWAVRNMLMVAGTALVLGWAMDAASVVGALLFGIHSIASFNNPLKSGSVTELWRARWNVLTSHTLRWLIYDPIVDGSLVAPGGLPHSTITTASAATAAARAAAKGDAPSGNGLPAGASTAGSAGGSAGGAPSAGGSAHGDAAPGGPSGEAARTKGGPQGAQQGAGSAAGGPGSSSSSKQGNGQNSRAVRKAEAARAAAQLRERAQVPRRMLGTFAVFVGCGALHELAYWLANGHLTPGLRWTWFFTSQGLGVLLERGWLGWTDGLGPGDAVTVMMQDSRAFGPSTPYKAGQLVNRAFSWLWTIGFMGFSLHFLWLPPCASPNMAACFIPA